MPVEPAPAHAATPSRARRRHAHRAALDPRPHRGGADRSATARDRRGLRRRGRPRAGLPPSRAGTMRARRVTEDDVVVLCESSTQFPLLREAFLRRGLRTTETRSDDVARTPAAARRGRRPRRAAGSRRRRRARRDGARLVRRRRRRRRVRRTARERAWLEWGAALESRGVVALGRAMTDPVATRGLLRRRFGRARAHRRAAPLRRPGHDGAPRRGPDRAARGARRARGGCQDLRRRRRPVPPDRHGRARRSGSCPSTAPRASSSTSCSARSSSGRAPTTSVPSSGTTRRSAAVSSTPAAGRSWTDDGLAAATRDARASLAASASGSETRRLLYVALTRARHRTVVWWLRAYTLADARRDELTALLLDRDDAHTPVQRPRAEREGDGRATSSPATTPSSRCGRTSARWSTAGCSSSRR